MKSERTSVQLSISDNHAEILLSSKNGLNILNTDVLRDFHAALDEIAGNPSLKVVSIRSSSSKAFTAGADVVEMEGKSTSEAREFSELGQSLVRKLEHSLPPVTAVLRGYVLGGGLEIACGCDIRIASENCIFSQPEMGIGIFPGWGGTQRLTRLVGLGRASELIYLGSRIDAHEALHMGLVSKVVSDDTLEEFAKNVVDKLCTMSRNSLLGAKRAIRSSVEAPYESGFDMEREEWSSLFETPDQREGMRAFLERRKPKFIA
ncbi:MAG: enoyl-CoA hydratase/isomerase family protein [Thermoplasmata archaeon]